MTGTEEFREFVAAGEAFISEESVPVIVSGNYPLYEAGSVSVTIAPDIDALPLQGLPSALSGEARVVGLQAELADGKEIWTPALRLHSTKSFRGRDTGEYQRIQWEGTADFFMEGDLQEFDASDGTLVYSLITNPSPLAKPSITYSHNQDGTISIFGDEEKKTLHWQTSIGEATYTDHFSYPLADKLGYYQTWHRLRRFAVTLTRRLTGSVSPKSLLTELNELFESAFSMISFLSRKRVDWYHAELLYLPDNNLERDPRLATARRRRWLGYEREETLLESSVEYSLLRLNELREGLFDDLVVSFENSAHRPVLKNIITHLLMSHEDIYLENRYTSAYTAFESLVYLLSMENRLNELIDKDTFQDLREELKQSVRIILSGDDELSRALRGSIYRKLPELRRRAFKEQLLKLKEMYELQLGDLWPEGSEVNRELKQLVNRRNVYLHQGVMENHEAYLYDLNRIQNVVELWLLKLLDVPRNAVNPAALGHLVPIDRYNPS